MKKIKAVVITDDHYNGLGMVRSLGLAGIEVTLLLTASDKSFVDSSKYVDKCIKIYPTAKAIITEVNKIISEYSDTTIVLFPLNDFTAQVLDENITSFPSNVLCPNAKGKMHKLSDKYFIKTIAEDCGFVVPKGVLVDLDKTAYIFWSTFPAIIKPLVSVEGAKSDIAIIQNTSELELEYQRYRDQGYTRALVEEFIDGSNSHMIEVMGARNLDSSIDFAGIISKIREFPIQNGSTSYASIVSTHDGIEFDSITNFLNRIDYVGIFDIEYKYANGKAYFIECNFRNGAPGFIFTKIGHNIPAIWIEKNLKVDLGVEHKQVPEINFMIEQNDFINMLKGTPVFFKWQKQYKEACKIFSLKGDQKPVRRYYKQFVVNQLLRRFQK